LEVKWVVAAAVLTHLPVHLSALEAQAAWSLNGSTQLKGGIHVRKD
jgi:hypothetical protein